MPLLNCIIQQCWKDFDSVIKNNSTKSLLVKDSIPILWFGNEPSYSATENRILTIGLNPSREEFYDRKIGRCTHFRFPCAPSHTAPSPLSSIDIDNYKNAMNEYFINKPYTRWFNGLEIPLNYLGATYYYNKLTDRSNSHEKNINKMAIHIDLVYFATWPSWGKLSKKQKDSMKRACNININCLINYFNPKVILVSFNQNLVKEIFTDINGDGCTKSNGQRWDSSKAGYIYSHILCDDRLLIWGSNYKGTPFGGMNKKEINNAMNDIMKEYTKYFRS